MPTRNMKSPLLDVVGFTSLLVTLPWLHWLLASEPYARALGSYGAAFVVVWRFIVLVRRGYQRRLNRHSAGQKNEDDQQ